MFADLVKAFDTPINDDPILRRWAEATQRRNYDSLRKARGPYGDPLVPNAPYTIRKKGHDRVGFGVTLQMGPALLHPKAYNLRIGGNISEAQVFGGPGFTDWKLNIFLNGTGEHKAWKSEKTKSGKRKAWQYTAAGLPPRDFIGVHMKDIVDAANDAMESVLRTWGFR